MKNSMTFKDLALNSMTSHDCILFSISFQDPCQIPWLFKTHTNHVERTLLEEYACQIWSLLFSMVQTTDWLASTYNSCLWLDEPVESELWCLSDRSSSYTYHSCPWLDEPVESELRCLSDRSSSYTYHSCPWLDEPVESELRCLSDRSSSYTYHSCPWLDEPVESELRCLSDRRP